METAESVRLSADHTILAMSLQRWLDWILVLHHGDSLCHSQQPSVSQVQGEYGAEK